MGGGKMTGTKSGERQQTSYGTDLCTLPRFGGCRFCTFSPSILYSRDGRFLFTIWPEFLWILFCGVVCLVRAGGAASSMASFNVARIPATCLLTVGCESPCSSATWPWVWSSQKSLCNIVRASSGSAATRARNLSNKSRDSASAAGPGQVSGAPEYRTVRSPAAFRLFRAVVHVVQRVAHDLEQPGSERFRAIVRLPIANREEPRRRNDLLRQLLPVPRKAEGELHGGHPAPLRTAIPPGSLRQPSSAPPDAAAGIHRVDSPPPIACRGPPSPSRSVPPGFGPLTSRRGRHPPHARCRPKDPHPGRWTPRSDPRSAVAHATSPRARGARCPYPQRSGPFRVAREMVATERRDIERHVRSPLRSMGGCSRGSPKLACNSDLARGQGNSGLRCDCSRDSSFLSIALPEDGVPIFELLCSAKSARNIAQNSKKNLNGPLIYYTSKPERVAWEELSARCVRRSREEELLARPPHQPGLFHGSVPSAKRKRGPTQNDEKKSDTHENCRVRNA